MVMSKYPFRPAGVGLAVKALAACVALAWCSPLPAPAADRTVLCEEFTNVL